MLRHAYYDDEVNIDALSVMDILALPLAQERVCTCFRNIMCHNCRAWRKEHPHEWYVPEDPRPEEDDSILQQRIDRARASVARLSAERDNAPERTALRRGLGERLQYNRVLLQTLLKAQGHQDKRARVYKPRYIPMNIKEVWEKEDTAVAALEHALLDKATTTTLRDKARAQERVKRARQDLRNIRNLRIYHPREEPIS